MIDLCAKEGVTDVLYLEDRDEIVDKDHIARTVERYGLNVMAMNSGRAVLYFLSEKPYLVGFPFVNASVMMPMPTNVDPYEPGRSFTCVDDRLRAYHGMPIPSGADLIINGFKLADWETNTCRIVIDELSPEAKAEYLSRYREVQEHPPGIRVCCPLLHWSHEDVWTYLGTAGVETSPRMYAGRSKRPYYNRVCYRCHDPYGEPIVTCPKTGQRLTNLSHYTKDADLSVEMLRRMGVFEGELNGV